MRNQTNVGKDAATALEEAQTAIAELFTQIRDIKASTAEPILQNLGFVIQTMIHELIGELVMIYQHVILGEGWRVRGDGA